MFTFREHTFIVKHGNDSILPMLDQLEAVSIILKCDCVPIDALISIQLLLINQDVLIELILQSLILKMSCYNTYIGRLTV